MDLLRDFNIAVPMYKVATDPDGAQEIAEEFGTMHICASLADQRFWRCWLFFEIIASLVCLNGSLAQCALSLKRLSAGPGFNPQIKLSFKLSFRAHYNIT